MPNRMLRDWTNSDKIDQISFQAEVFFTRLIMKADDYGSFWADAKRLKANLYPLKSDSVRDADILRWMAECQKAELIVVYESEEKKYLQICDFGQRLRSKKSKFPKYDSNTPAYDSTLQANGGLKKKEEEYEVEEEEKVSHTSQDTKSKWNTKPGETDINLELPELSIGAVIQQFKFTKNKTVNQEQVLGLWAVFKAQNFTGEKFYQSPKQVFSHFISWCKLQQVEETTRPARSKESDKENMEKLKKLHGSQ